MEEIDLAFGLYINLDRETEKAIVALLSQPEKKIVEVRVVVRGQTKDFTLADFLSRLGFYEESTADRAPQPPTGS